MPISLMRPGAELMLPLVTHFHIMEYPHQWRVIANVAANGVPAKRDLWDES